MSSHQRNYGSYHRNSKNKSRVNSPSLFPGNVYDLPKCHKIHLSILSAHRGIVPPATPPCGWSRFRAWFTVLRSLTSGQSRYPAPGTPFRSLLSLYLTSLVLSADTERHVFTRRRRFRFMSAHYSGYRVPVLRCRLLD